MAVFPHIQTSSTKAIPCAARDLVTDDADCLAHSISGWSQEYEQLKCGQFQGSLSELCFGSTQLFLEQTSHALRQVCVVPADYVWFGLPFSTSRSVRINGVAVDADRIAMHRGGVDFELVTPDQLQFWGIVVKEELLMDYARQFECEAHFQRILDQPVMGVCDERIRSVQQVCNGILSRPGVEEDHGAELPEPLRRSLADKTLSALFSLFDGVEPISVDRRSVQHRHRLVERADAFVRTHTDRLVTVSELCSELSVSRRALQNGFQEVLGVSPHAYIRTISLNGVRSHLKNADSPYACVQDAAAAYGFWHMSQFALDYRHLFGELPSATIKRRSAAD